MALVAGATITAAAADSILDASPVVMVVRAGVGVVGR